jgi:hypothetical protein
MKFFSFAKIILFSMEISRALEIRFNEGLLFLKIKSWLNPA